MSTARVVDRIPAGALLGFEHRTWCELWSPEGVRCSCDGTSDPLDVIDWWAGVAAQTDPHGPREPLPLIVTPRGAA